MPAIPDDELISAYLDNELSGEELARAEQLLATRPECRQLLEELTALRASLQSLPHASLGPGFSKGVLHRAEREILQPAAGAKTVAGSARAAAAAPIAPTTYEGDQRPILSWQRWQRPLAWSAMAIAAGLLIMLFSPDRQQVAMSPAPPGGEPRAGAPAATALAKRDEGTPADADRAGERLAAPAAMPTAAPQLADKIATKDADQSGGGGAEKANAAFDSADLKDAVASSDEQLATGDDGLLVVNFDIPDRAAAEAALRDVLATNQIELQPQQLAAQTTALAADEGANAAAADKQMATDAAGNAEAFFVVADTTQMRSALDTLATNVAFRNFTLDRVTAPAEELASYENQSPTIDSAAGAGLEPLAAKAGRLMKSKAEGQAAPESAADAPALAAKKSAPQPAAAMRAAAPAQTIAKPQSPVPPSAESRSAAESPSSGVATMNQGNRGRALQVPLVERKRASNYPRRLRSNSTVTPNLGSCKHRN